MSDKGPVSRVYEELLQPNNKMLTQSKMDKGTEQTFL